MNKIKTSKMRTSGFAVCVFLTITLPAVTVDAVNCTTPPVPTFMSVSYNGTTPGSLATYTCLPGYVRDHNNTVTLTCDMFGMWSGPAVVCSPVNCHDPPDAVDATVSYNSTTYLSKAVYVCNEGLVDIRNGAMITCSANGTWTTPTVVCKPADCGDPPNIASSFMVNRTGDTGYLSQASYQCYSGHYYYETAQVTATCRVVGVQAKWDGLLPGVMYCSRSNSYAGCFSAGLTSIGTYGRYACKDLCFAQKSGFFALRGEECACLNSLTSSTAVGDGNCTMTCGDDKLCGGEPDLWSIYATFQGCYANLSMTGSFLAYGDKACREYCRGSDHRISAYTLDQCLCLDQADGDAVGVALTLCTKGNSTDFVEVTTVEMYDTEGDTCMALFKKGIHISGHYYLDNTTSPTMCHFYDGTVCDPYWIGFEGSCYRWSPNTLNYSDTVHFCTANDAVPVTIHTFPELIFVKTMLGAIDQFLDVSDLWYIGLYDHFGVFSRQWSDGTVLTYDNFQAAEPNEMTKKCTAMHRTELKWYDSLCTARYPSVCERPKGVYGCVTIATVDVDQEYAFSSLDLMSLTRCFETCRGHEETYAAVSGSTCYCLDDLPEKHAIVPWNQCSTPCPGNEFQLCGDPKPGVNLTAFVIEDAGQPRTGGCLELALQGIVGSDLAITRGGDTDIVNCTQDNGVTCPYSWGNVNGRCYKFFLQTGLDPYTVCGTSFESYPAVMDNDLELEAVFNDTSSLQGLKKFTIGLFRYHGKGVFRTSNGRPLTGMPLPLSTGSYQCVSYDVSTGLMASSDCASEAFICENGPEYKGCAVTSPGDVLILDDYSEMSVIQCVELCRGQGLLYALLGNNPFRCYCSNQVIDTTETCGVFCYTGAGQPCGGATFRTVSAYRVEAFPVFANACADLFNEGIFVPGTYIIQNLPVWCNMKDNTSCSVADRKDWVSVGESGTCFKLSYADILQRDGDSTCKALRPTHRLASIRSQRELDLLKALYNSLKSAYLEAPINIGAVDEFVMNVFTWADGFLFDFVAWTIGSSTVSYPDADSVYTRLESTMTVTNRNAATAARRTLCRQVTDHLGCFQKTLFTQTAIIANYSSMGVTVCKQTCLGQNSTVALLDVESCYCVHTADLAGLVSLNATETGCDVPCPANRLQSCADSGKLRAYRVDPDDVAKNCSTLHANFVVLENTYMLRNAVTGQNQPTQCGLADNTKCAPGYFGYRGKCYRFFPFKDRTAQGGAEVCRTFGGYLATPRDGEEVTFIIRAAQSVPSLSTMSEWRLGILDLMTGKYQAASDGSLMRSEKWNGTRDSVLTECSSLKVGTGQWTKSLCNATLPFVCEASPVFLGCMQFTPAIVPALSFDLTLTSSTAQQCVTLCNAQDARYALVTQTTCGCVADNVYQASSKSAVTCPLQCGDAFSQLCGQANTSKYAVYDTAAYSLEVRTARSCSQYREYLVTAWGQYDLHVNGTSTLRVQCGNLGSKHGDILLVDALSSQYTASSGNTTAVNARLLPQTLWWTTWSRDATDNAPWVQVSLSDYFLVKAISITGGESLSKNGYVVSFNISYGLFSTGLTSYVDTFQGPSSRTEIVTRFIPEPFVAKVIRVRPLTWSADPHLAFTLLGERYNTFNHSDWYVGCFANPGYNLVTSYYTALTLEDCKNHCLGQRYPFFALFSSASIPQQCACAGVVGDYGRLDDTKCNASCLFSRCGNDVTMSLAFYRTYKKQCPQPQLVINATSSQTYLVTTPGVFTFGTNVTYTCLTGHEFPDLTSVSSITCLQNNTWSWLMYDTCGIKQCPMPVSVANGQMTYTGRNYGDRAAYRCHNNFETEAGSSNAVSYCTAAKVWNPPAPVCASQKAYRSRMVCKGTQGQSLSGSSVVSLRARSLADCARFCLIDAACSLYSFPSNRAALPAGADNCRMHVGFLTTPVYMLDSAWGVYGLDGACE